MLANKVLVFFSLIALSISAHAQEAQWQWSVPVRGGKTNADAQAWLWIPPTCKKIRAVIVAQNNMEELSIIANPAFRDSMQKLDVAEIWISPLFDQAFTFTEGAGATFNRMISDLTAASGYTELQAAPVIGIGHSAAASWPYYFAAWAPERTLTCISVSGQWPFFRDKRFAPDIWSKDQNVDYIPCLETMGEYEAAASWSAEGLRERHDHPAMPLSMLACPEEGHFAATQKKIGYIAFYIRKAIQYRLSSGQNASGPPILKKIDPRHTGWLIQKWSPDSPQTTGPVNHYKGDPADAFWFFDEETARRTQQYEKPQAHRHTPLIAYLQHDTAIRQRNTHLQVELRWLPLPDGISFVLKTVFLDTVPGESPRPAIWTGQPVGSKLAHPDNAANIHINTVIGPVEKINDTLFRLALKRESFLPRPPKRYTLTLAAVYPGDGSFKSITQQAEMQVPVANTAGRTQNITFPSIRDQQPGADPIPLDATSDAGLPVAYTIVEGPAYIANNKIYLTALPPRGHYPIKVTVAAWQYGRSTEPKIQTAAPVLQSFWIGRKPSIPIEKVISLAEQQYGKYIATHRGPLAYPRDTKPDGTLGEASPEDWTSGFFPGSLWYLYRFTKQPEWRDAADRWTRGLAAQQYNTSTHDLGFMLFDSYGQGYLLTGDTGYRSTLIQGAKSLSTRFHSQVGAIRSWDNPDFHYPVIIDNLMNLEYLFWATAVTGDSSFYKIAVAHANTDLRYRFRPDGSSYHVLDFDSANGNLLRRMTHQGYSDSSCWARGQAWGIYGYTTLYRETGDKRYLDRAIKTADYFIAQTDRITDHIPYWDFQAPDIPTAPRDASAAAVAASAMLELGRYAGEKYRRKAEELLTSLCSDTYLAKPGTNNGFLLKHSTGHKPHNAEIDVPIIYADYYFLEALWRYQQSQKAQPQKAQPQKAQPEKAQPEKAQPEKAQPEKAQPEKAQPEKAQPQAKKNEATLRSPDSHILATLYQKENKVYYTVTYNGKPVIEQSQLDIHMDNHILESALALPPDTTRDWCADLELQAIDTTTKDTTWHPLYGENAAIRDHYNETTLTFIKKNRPKYSMQLIVRAYDQGIAIRYYFPENPTGVYYHITAENTDFTFPAGTKAWFTAWAQGPYRLLPLQNWPDESERPLPLQLPDSLYACLAESQNVGYARTKFKLSPDKSNTIRTSLYDAVDGITYFGTPWRVILIGRKPADLITAKDLLLNLNPPNAINPPSVANRPAVSETGHPADADDKDWIKPGKIIRELTLTTEGAKNCIDFAAAHNMQYLLFDWKWYGPAMTFNTDATRVVAPIDMPAVVAYGKKKGIGIWLYVNMQSLVTQLDSILPLYEKWGIKGIKMGFVELGSQRWTVWLEEAIHKAAAHHLLLDIHDEWRPTGEQRTWPNLLSAEGIRGNEEMPDATHNTILPFTRYIAGPADYTICYYNRRIKTTHAHQLALACVYYTPLLTLFWYDKPTDYHGEPEIEFFDKIPTTWDETRVLGGAPGEYVSIARRKDTDWYIGTITNDSARTITTALNFLEKGKKYKATIYSDDPAILTATHVRREQRIVDNTTVLETHLQPSGGEAIWLTPASR